MADAQVLFRVEKELLDALDRILTARGFKTRNEWFRAQVRETLEREGRRKRALDTLDRLAVEGIGEGDIVRMVREWRSRKARR